MAIYSLTREIYTENLLCRISSHFVNFHVQKHMIIVAIFLSSILLCLQSTMDIFVILAYITRYYTTQSRLQPFKDEAQTDLFKDPIHTAQ